MGFQNFEKALELAKQCRGYMSVGCKVVGGGKSDEVISHGEKLIGFKFSRQTYEFFKRVGFLMFSGKEIYGIVMDDFSGDTEDNAVEFSLKQRKEWKLPKEWLCIYNFGFDGYMGYLDYSDLNADGEPPVIMAVGAGKKYIVAERVAEDLGDFILGLVEEQLARQSQ